MTLTLFAAASLRYSIEEAETYYKQSHSNVDFSNNFGSSATVADQIDQGAPVDVFISAAAKPMDDLGGKGLIVEVRALIC
jgi:molybdate transport system substrate-binding protein